MKLYFYWKHITKKKDGFMSELISVIVPVFNVADYLEKCVDSVLTQSFSDFELILIDDGSTDGSAKICDGYAREDGRVRVIHKENCGAGEARNLGIDLAVGKYIIFLDGDDYWAPDTLLRLWIEAEKNNLQLLLFSGEPFWDGIEPGSYRLSYHRTTQNDIIMSGSELVSKTLLGGDYYSSPCLRFSLLSFIREGGFRFDEGVIHEDESFSFLSSVRADRVECIGDRLYKRRYRRNSVMTGKNLLDSARGYGRAVESVIARMDEDSGSKDETEVFALFVQVLIRNICDIYKRSLSSSEDRGEGRKLARMIRKATGPALKKSAAFRKNLSMSPRLATHGIRLWYACVRMANLGPIASVYDRVINNRLRGIRKN